MERPSFAGRIDPPLVLSEKSPTGVFTETTEQQRHDWPDFALRF